MNVTEPYWGMINQHWYIGNGFGAIRQPAITWSNVDPDMASPGHTELIQPFSEKWGYIILFLMSYFF